MSATSLVAPRFIFASLPRRVHGIRLFRIGSRGSQSPMPSPFPLQSLTRLALWQTPSLESHPSIDLPPGARHRSIAKIEMKDHGMRC